MMPTRLLNNFLKIKPTHALNKTSRAVSNFWISDMKGFRLKEFRRRRKTESSFNTSSQDGDGEEEEEINEKGQNYDKDFMKLTCTILKYLCRLNILPYVWDESSRQMLNHQTKFYFYVWIFAVAGISFANFSFVLFRFVQCLFVNFRAVQKNELSSIIPIWSALAFRSMLAVMTYSMLQHMEAVLCFTNQMIRFRVADGRPELRRDFPACKIMATILVMRSFQLMITGCTKAARPQFIYSLLPLTWRNFYTYFIYVFFTIMANLTTLILIYYAAFPLTMVDTLEVILKTRFPPFTPPRYKLMQYRQLQILLLQFHACVGALAMNYLKIYTLIISTTCAFGCVRFYDDLDMRIYVTMPISLISLMTYGFEWYGRSGTIPLLSQAAVKHMFDSRHEGNNRRLVYENRYCMYSCRKLVVAKVKRHTFPSIVKFVCLQTIRMLIVSTRGK